MQIGLSLRLVVADDIKQLLVLVRFEREKAGFTMNLAPTIKTDIMRGLPPCPSLVIFAGGIPFDNAQTGWSEAWIWDALRTGSERETNGYRVTERGSLGRPMLASFVAVTDPDKLRHRAAL